MTHPRILIAGIGNIFLGDDGFGVEVAQRMARRALPDGVRVVDFGIRGIDLTYALLDGYDTAILVDAVQRGGTPGTLYVIEPDVDGPAVSNAVTIDMHGMDPIKVLNTVRTLGGTLSRLLVVGCEPVMPDGDDDWQMGLSKAGEAAVGEAISLLEDLIARIGDEGGPRGSIARASVAS